MLILIHPLNVTNIHRIQSDASGFYNIAKKKQLCVPFSKGDVDISKLTLCSHEQHKPGRN